MSARDHALRFQREKGRVSRPDVRLVSERERRHRLRTPCSIPPGTYPRGLTLKAREAACRRMGYTGYDGYLRSDLWKGIRRRVMEGGEGLCSCGAPAAQVHHAYYSTDNLSGESLDGLLPVCHPCHRQLDQEMRSRRAGRKRRA